MKVVHTRGRYGRILRRQPNRQDYRERQGQEQQLVQALPVRVGWPGGPIDVSLLTRTTRVSLYMVWSGTQ
ncbi:hypothetical protein P8452_01473 [Trifolium repens]|nr:hypothetical protein P8452_01473 [Trifolium repens]